MPHAEPDTSSLNHRRCDVVKDTWQHMDPFQTHKSVPIYGPTHNTVHI